MLRAEEKIEPLLQAQLAVASDGDLVEVVIGVVLPSELPELPSVRGTVRGTPEHAAALGYRHEVFASAERDRLRSQDHVAATIAAMGGDVSERLAVGNAIVARLRVADLYELLDDPEVRHADPRSTGDGPPVDGNPNNDIIDGRARIGTDSYFDFGFTGEGSGLFVGLLDTGVRPTHVVAVSPPDDNLDFWRDCVYGNSACANGGNPSFNPDDTYNHGTASFGILAGNTALGAAWRGVSDATVDSWKVYSPTTLDVAAAIKAFGQAVVWGDDVIVAEMQALLSDTSSLAVAADDAHAAGAAVIAANGNFGPPAGSVRCPANAHRVLGVGSYSVENGFPELSQSYGPAPDGRIKPDLTAPSQSESASTACSTCTYTYGGTSGSTPYIGGAAIILRDFLATQGMPSAAGNVYAALLAFGQRASPQGNSEGTGPTRLENVQCRVFQTGSVSLEATGSEATVQFYSSPQHWNLQVAIWWPEPTTFHNNIDLSVRDTSGVERASGTLVPSVFEMDNVLTSLSPIGNWTVYIRAQSITTGPQTVYYFITRYVPCS